jgi:hypothetical protein
MNAAIESERLHINPSKKSKSLQNFHILLLLFSRGNTILAAFSGSLLGQPSRSLRAAFGQPSGSLRAVVGRRAMGIRTDIRRGLPFHIGGRNPAERGASPRRTNGVGELRISTPAFPCPIFAISANKSSGFARAMLVQ